VLRRATAISLALVLCVAFTASAGTTGKIAGRVIDLDGNPLIGAAVMIVGTSYGAMTDANGEYFIINLIPGTYNLRAQMVGMGVQEVQGVQVVADLTTRMDFNLSTTAVGLTTVLVTDQRAMIERGVTASITIVSRDEIKTLPVAGIQDIVNRQAGAVDRGGLHMRGGRAGEVVYLVDGVAQFDPTTNVFNSDIPMSSVAETSIISGGFGAEYGNAQSGVINIITREGGNGYSGSVEVSGNDFQMLGLADDYHWQNNANDAGPFTEARANAEVSIGGPEPLTSYLLPRHGSHRPRRSASLRLRRVDPDRRRRGRAIPVQFQQLANLHGGERQAQHPPQSPHQAELQRLPARPQRGPQRLELFPLRGPVHHLRLRRRPHGHNHPGHRRPLHPAHSFLDTVQHGLRPHPDHQQRHVRRVQAQPVHEPLRVPHP